MAPTALHCSTPPVTCFPLVLLCLLLDPGGGGASPVSSKFRVYGIDTVRAGVEAFLTCFLEGSDTGSVTRPPSYVWVKDGKVIPGQTDMTLNFKAVTKEDAGLYQCGAPGSDVGGQGRHLYVVVPGDILPRPTVDYRDHPVCGRAYSLRCLFLERYIPSDNTVYTWYKDHAQVKGQTGQTLTFPNVTETDGGEYVCTGREGGVETTSPPSQEYLMLPLVVPQITIEAPSTDSVAKGILGQNLTLTAKVIRALPQVPRDGYSWSFFPFPQGQQRPLAERTRTLTLGPLTLEHRGQYVCQARNDQANPDLQLIGLASLALDVVYLKNVTLTPDLEVNEGDLVTLTCGVDSHPTARLAWTVNGQEVRHVTYNVDHYVIPSAACSDSTNYTCAASNTELPGLERTATTQLTVLCRQDSSEPPTTGAVPTTSDTGVKLAADESHMWKTYVMVPTGLAVALVAVVVLVLCWRRLPLKMRRRLLKRLNHYLLPDPMTRLREDVPEAETDVEMQIFMEQPSHTEREPLLEVSASVATGETELRQRRGKQSSENSGRGQVYNTDAALQRTRTGSHAAAQKSKSERRKVPPPQGQKVNFDAAYQKGQVHVLPPLQDSNIRQPAEGQGKEEDLGKMGSKDVIQRLHQLLSGTVRADDPPVFLFTQSLPCHTHAIIYHQRYGVIIVKVNSLESVDDASRSLLKKTARDLQDARGRLQEELQEQLHPDGVTLLLALPNLEDSENLDNQDKAWLQKRDVQILAGKTQDKYRAWLQTLSTTERLEPWGLGGDSNHAFRTAVSGYLSMTNYDDSGDPTNWLVTREQASVLHSTDKLVHVWGPPGSGKTLLLVDRVRRWLWRGKTVVLAVCGSPYELLLHRLGRMVFSRESDDMPGKLMFCKSVKQLKMTMESLGKGKNPSSFCVAVDAIEVQFLRALLDACRSYVLDSAWTTSRADFPQSEEFEKLGGRRVHLPHTLRCSGPVLQLINTLLPIEANTAACLAFLHVSASLPSNRVSIQRHADHLPVSPANFDCGKCDEWLKGVLSPQGTSLALYDRRWKHWVVLLTGDWGSESKQLTEKLVDWLTRHRVPAVHEWQPDCHVSNLGVSNVQSGDGGSHDKEDRAEIRARVEVSVDREGLPAVHMMQGSLFRGLEKPCVLVVHYDWRDEHADHQSREQRDARLTQHQRQLFRAATRCRTTLAVLLLSPSPAASLLP